MKCVVQSMKKVFFYEFQGSRSEVAFLKFIAERGRVLEQMVVVVAKLKPLTSANWSSKACKVEFSKSPHTEPGSPIYSNKIASDFGFADPFDLLEYH
uniref:FBD domain-containing protein n=2 Tax=Aegilops tauschii TaxID=37682 RepID=A0A453GHM3_AEGTS